MSAEGLHWRWYDWDALDVDTLYAFLRLRSEIFVVEQTCPYPDMDGLDAQCLHLCGSDGGGELRAYLRLLPPGLKSPQPAIGRLVVSAAARRGGHARLAMQRAIARCEERHPGQDIYLSGQQHLERFYASLGFRTVSAPYLEDGIPHVDMIRPARP